MAVLIQTPLGGNGFRAPTPNTLTSSDTLTWTQGTKQVLVLLNTTAGALTVTLTGSAAVATVEAGGGVVNYQNGLSSGSIAATTGRTCIPLDAHPGYMAGGTVTITGGTGITAYLFGY